MAEYNTDEPLCAGTLKLLGGRLSLDFVNTVYSHRAEEPEEFLTSYGELLAWAEHAGLLGGEAVQRLEERAAEAPDEARAVLQRALALREALFRTVLAFTEGNEPEGGDVRLLNGELQQALSHLEVAPSAGAFGWSWRGGGSDLDRPLWPVVEDAARLLTSTEMARVKVCDDDACGWLFLDTSRNRSRRWCSMEDCGNRAKARRYYRRQQGDG